MIKVNKRNIHRFGDTAEVVMIESRHFSAFVSSPLAEVLILSELESPSIKQFAIFIGSFLIVVGTLCYLSDCVSLLLGQLLYLDIIEFVIVQKLAQNDVEVRSGGWGRRLNLVQQ